MPGSVRYQGVIAIFPTDVVGLAFDASAVFRRMCGTHQVFNDTGPVNRHQMCTEHVSDFTERSIR